MTDLLAKLAEWECRQDHDLGPGLRLTQAWLQLFGDGSGSVIAELATEADVDGVNLNNLLTNLGLAGRMERPFSFDSIEQAEEILSQPIVLDYRR